MKKKQLSEAKFGAAVDAHNAENQGRTPERARAAFLAGPRDVAGLTIHPCTLATQILLEEINHPILQVSKAQSEAEAAAVVVGARDILNLIFVFAKPEEAWRTLGYSRENFNAAARDFGLSVAPQVVGEVIPVIRDMLFQSGRTIPAGNHSESEATDPLAGSQPQAQA